MAIICTLFEGNYHYGLGALVNSLHARGFRGHLYAGYRGELPPWAVSKVRQNGAGTLLDIAPECTVHFLPVDTERHLNNYKPLFVLELMRQHPDDDGFFFFDPDIIVRAHWLFFEEWVTEGIALCEDINHYMPRNHPVRRAWKRYAAQRGLAIRQDLDNFYNGGFFGVRREHAGFLHTWNRLFETRAAEGVDLRNIKLNDLEFPYLFLDQDLMNLALMLGPHPISAVGPEGMDFVPGGYVMSHSAGDTKSWRKRFVWDALQGRAPTRADKEFLQHTQYPISIYSRRKLATRRVSVRIGAAIGRFYRRR